MTQLHHINIPVLPRPEADTGGAWMAIGDGTQLHLSERDGANHPKAHFARDPAGSRIELIAGPLP